METSNGRTSLIVLASFDPFMLAAIEEIVKLSRAEGADIMVLDITPCRVTACDTYDPLLLRLLGYQGPRRLASVRLNAHGCRLVRLGKSSETTRQIPAGFECEINEAIDSACITFLRDHALNAKSRSLRNLRRNLRASVGNIYSGLLPLLEGTPSVTQIYIPNGRFPDQRIVQLTANALGIECLHYERGEPPGGVYLQPYAPQDRVASQMSVERILSTHEPSEVASISARWLSERSRPGSVSNPFSLAWEQMDGAAQLDGANRWIGLFTSSQDEFVHLGRDWQLHSWVDQFAAFDFVLSQVDWSDPRLGVYIRVHPNLATKSHRYFKSETRSIQDLIRQYPGLMVFWHDDPISSYQLLRQTALCFVWDSTIGLEASAAGIPTWTLAKSRYGDIADVRELLGPGGDNDLLTGWSVDSKGAQKFAAYLVLRDVQLTSDPSHYMGWHPLSEPLGVKIAHALSSGGYASLKQTALSVIDIYRNRGFRSSIKRVLRRIPSSRFGGMNGRFGSRDRTMRFSS